MVRVCGCLKSQIRNLKSQFHYLKSRNIDKIDTFSIIQLEPNYQFEVLL